MKLEFFKCEVCGNIAVKIVDSKVPLVCCGQEMTLLNANTTDAAQEKHVPVVEVNGNIVEVTVGEVEHPMVEEHYIQFITIETEKTVQTARLQPGEKPYAKFALADDDKLVAAYEYCNLHGLWKKQ
ncbi:MAG: desulfoferrodoxin family protein [Clostridia bacterium]|nr:desulfoferrodoxin family protein [Clostridia bacterium]